MSRRIAPPILLLLLVLARADAGFLRVPYDYPTITQACEVAQSGDTVGVYPGQYFESAFVNPGVTITGVTPDSMLVWVRASTHYGPFIALVGEDPVIIENMTIWGGRNWVVANGNPNFLLQRCYLYAYDVEGTGEFQWLIDSTADFTVRQCTIVFGTQAPNLFQLNEPSHVLMEDCVIWGSPFFYWCPPPGSRFEFRNNSIDGELWIELDLGCESTDFSVIVVNSIMNVGLCVDVPDTMEWRYNDFVDPGGWPDCGFQVGNFAADPLYCDPWPGELDYRLQPETPCLGAGENGEDVGARIGVCWDPAAVGDDPEGVGGLRLLPPEPNPTSGAVRLSWEAEVGTDVEIEVLDVGGRLVRRLVGGGRGTVLWDGRDSGGREVSGGIYFLHAATGGRQAAKRVVIVR